MNWFQKFFTTPAKSVTKSISVGVRSMLGGALAGSWATDHREEVNHFTGFNYVAIHAIANQVAEAEVLCFMDREPEKAISRRKAIRQIHTTVSRYKSLYGQTDDATEDLAQGHPLVNLMKRPNPYETGSTFRYKQAMQIRLTGTCLVWNVPSVAGQTCQRYVLPTAMTTPVMPTAEMPLGAWRVSGYSSRYIPLNNQGFVEGSPTWTNVLGKVIDARNVQIIRLPHPWWFDDGQSPISAGAQWVDQESGVNTARVGQLANGADPSLIWELPPDITPDQDEIDRATKKVNDKYGGPTKSGSILIATNGTKVTPVSASPKDMCYSEAFQDTKAAILSLHQTPPVAVGLQDPGAYAAYYASMKAWRSAAIQPLCGMLAESDTIHLAPQFGDGITIEFEAPSIDDKDQEEKEFSNNVTARVCTLNELRAKRGLPPYPGPEGEQLWPPQAAPAAAAGPGDAMGSDSSSVPFPKTPIGQGDDNKGEDETGIPWKPQTKALRAAIRAAHDGDLEWLASKLKAFDPSQQSRDDGICERDGEPAESSESMRACLEDPFDGAGTNKHFGTIHPATLQASVN